MHWKIKEAMVQSGSTEVVTFKTVTSMSCQELKALPRPALSHWAAEQRQSPIFSSSQFHFYTAL